MAWQWYFLGILGLMDFMAICDFLVIKAPIFRDWSILDAKERVYQVATTLSMSVIFTVFTCLLIFVSVR